MSVYTTSIILLCNQLWNICDTQFKKYVPYGNVRTIYKIDWWSCFFLKSSSQLILRIWDIFLRYHTRSYILDHSHVLCVLDYCCIISDAPIFHCMKSYESCPLLYLMQVQKICAYFLIYLYWYVRGLCSLHVLRGQPII